MRRLAVLAAILLTFAAPASAPAYPDDETEKATADYKAIEKWTEEQKPKTADEGKALRAELAKRLRAFLKDHPAAGRPTQIGKNSLAAVLVVDGKMDDAIALYEDNLKNGEDELQQRARYGIIKALIDKKNTKGARARLDGFLKERPDDKNLLDLYDYLKKIGEGRAPVTLKVGAPAPAIKAKGADDKEIDLAAFKGKVVLIDFWATWCPPCKKEFPALKKLLAELKDKLEIVGVDCFEKDWAAYKTFIEKEQLAWPQIARDDAKKVSRDYGVENLPRTVIVGKSGEVLALDLRGDALAAAIRAAVEGKPIPPSKPRPEKPPEGTEKPAKLEPGDHPKSED